jgi:anti-sigma B factor antagonist
MKIETLDQCLRISEIPELTSVNSGHFRDQVLTVLPDAPPTIEIDLAQTTFVDSSGLGSLFTIYRATAQRDGVVLRLLNPKPEIQQLLELTQMHELFEIVQR